MPPCNKILSAEITGIMMPGYPQRIMAVNFFPAKTEVLVSRKIRAQVSRYREGRGGLPLWVVAALEPSLFGGYPRNNNGGRNMPISSLPPAANGQEQNTPEISIVLDIMKNALSQLTFLVELFTQEGINPHYFSNEGVAGLSLISRQILDDMSIVRDSLRELCAQRQAQ